MKNLLLIFTLITLFLSVCITANPAEFDFSVKEIKCLSEEPDHVNSVNKKYKSWADDPYPNEYPDFNKSYAFEVTVEKKTKGVTAKLLTFASFIQRGKSTVIFERKFVDFFLSPDSQNRDENTKAIRSLMESVCQPGHLEQILSTPFSECNSAFNKTCADKKKNIALTPYASDLHRVGLLVGRVQESIIDNIHYALPKIGTIKINPRNKRLVDFTLEGYTEN